MTQDKALDSSNGQPGKFRFGIQSMLLAVTLVATGIGLFLAFVPEKPVIGRISFFQVELPVGQLAYSRGSFDSYMLQEWINESKLSNQFPTQATECVIEIFEENGGTRKLVLQSTDSTHGPAIAGNQVIFRFRNRMRVGDYDKLKTIIQEPKAVWAGVQELGGKYFDIDNNGAIEIKYIDLDTSNRITWEDTDGDGFFDLETFAHHGQPIVGFAPRIIRVPVPTIEPEPNQ